MKIIKEDTTLDKNYNKLSKIDNRILDVLLLIYIKVLKDVAKGHKVNYFEKQAQEIVDTIFQIKKDRLYLEI